MLGLLWAHMRVSLFGSGFVDHPAPVVASYSGYVSDQVRVGTTSVSLLCPPSTGNYSSAGVFPSLCGAVCMGVGAVVDCVLRI